MLAYVFWHRPRPDVDQAVYEDGLRHFHDTLENPSAAFRLDELPFGDRGPGYEDWYLVEDWTALGELNARAVDARHRPAHDLPAGMSGHGWGGVYALVRGPAEPPAVAGWHHRAPAGDGGGLWQRQLVLGPAPEFCLSATGGQATRCIGRVPIGDPRSS